MTLVRLLILKIIKRVFESYSKQRAMKISWLFYYIYNVGLNLYFS